MPTLASYCDINAGQSYLLTSTPWYHGQVLYCEVFRVLKRRCTQVALEDGPASLLREVEMTEQDHQGSPGFSLTIRSERNDIYDQHEWVVIHSWLGSAGTIGEAEQSALFIEA